MRTTSIASYIECAPLAASHPQVFPAKKYFCMSQLSGGTTPASVTTLADILLAAGDTTAAAEFVEFTHTYFELNWEGRIALIEKTLAEDSVPMSSAA